MVHTYASLVACVLLKTVVGFLPRFKNQPDLQAYWEQLTPYDYASVVEWLHQHEFMRKSPDIFSPTAPISSSIIQKLGINKNVTIPLTKSSIPTVTDLTTTQIPQLTSTRLVSPYPPTATTTTVASSPTATVTTSTLSSFQDLSLKSEYELLCRECKYHICSAEHLFTKGAGVHSTNMEIRNNVVRVGLSWA